MKRVLYSILVCYVLGGTALAQTLQQSQSAGSQMQSTQPIQIPTSSTTFTSSADFFRALQAQAMVVQPPPYDTPVDTTRYILGPGDVMNVGIWGPTPLSYNLAVTPEGTLIVPGSGVLKIGGMVLADAKRLVRTELAKQFRNAAVTLTLIYPRTFYVMVSGKVKHPGRYTVTSFDRVDRAFTLSNMSPNVPDTSVAYPDFSLRRILLIHSDGSTQNVDLVKFYMTGNLSDDPTLREGDAIVVPEENYAAGSISISGAVRMQGNYEYVPGDRIKDLLELSAGLTTLADTGHVRVINWTGKEYEESTLNLNDTSAEDEELAPNSRVVVPTDRSKINDYFVWVQGEVKSPGIYPISRDSTKLSSIINLAGGFTKWASLPNAEMFRTSRMDHNTSFGMDTLALMGRATGISQEDLPYISQELMLRYRRNRVATDFIKIFVYKDSSYDCSLRSGDSIYVPRSSGAIYVFGQVNNPGYVEYHEGWNYSDYLKEAGGLSEGAKSGVVKVIKGGTYQWYDAGNVKLEPGDFMFVPRTIIREDLYTWDLFKDIMGVVGAVASIAATIILVVRTTQGR